jgi:hypothetical protein
MLEIVRCNAVMWRKLGFMREGECDCYYGVQVLCALKAQITSTSQTRKARIARLNDPTNRERLL